VVRYFYEWTPLLIIGASALLVLPGLALIALAFLALVGLAAVAWPIVALSSGVGRAVFRSGTDLVTANDTKEGAAMGNTVRDAMTADPRSIGATASVVEAAKLMREQHIGSLPITQGERLVGVITDRDITTRVVAEASNLEMTSVADVYSRDLVSVEPDENLEDALQLMARHKVRRLPVVEHDRLVGIVTQADIALIEDKTKTGALVEAISKPSDTERS
jgi:CBS domain-containing protein